MNQEPVVRVFGEDSVNEEPKIRLADFLDQYIKWAAKKRALNTMASNRQIISAFVKSLPDKNLCDVGGADAETWIDTMAGFSKSTIRMRILFMRGVFTYGTRTGLISKNPFANVVVPKKEFIGRILTDGEIRLLEKHIELPALTRAFWVALYTGMRRGEIASLHFWQVRDHDIVIPANKSKSKRERTIYLSPSARKYIGQGEGSVFGLNVNDINYQFGKAVKSSGLGRVRWHDLRHTAATRFMEESGDLFSLMDNFGWASEQSAKPYQHITEKRKKAMCGIQYRV